MCMAIPSRIIAIAGEMATVECFGEQRDVSLMLISSDVELGDYVLVQAGGFAFERVEHATAQEALQLFSAVIGQALTA
jgi:hydrogenase expression/formation protein HypC